MEFAEKLVRRLLAGFRGCEFSLIILRVPFVPEVRVGGIFPCDLRDGGTDSGGRWIARCLRILVVMPGGGRLAATHPENDNRCRQDCSRDMWRQ
ncbi:MAG TPA: hypothetical protein DDY91_03960 [Planctomycetaceae bacterium]|nr:hypothetical protein [Planctomycetaceae bacterium]